MSPQRCWGGKRYAALMDTLNELLARNDERGNPSD